MVSALAVRRQLLDHGLVYLGPVRKPLLSSLFADCQQFHCAYCEWSEEELFCFNCFGNTFEEESISHLLYGNGDN